MALCVWFFGAVCFSWPHFLSKSSSNMPNNQWPVQYTPISPRTDISIPATHTGRLRSLLVKIVAVSSWISPFCWRHQGSGLFFCSREVTLALLFLQAVAGCSVIFSAVWLKRWAWPTQGSSLLHQPREGEGRALGNTAQIAGKPNLIPTCMSTPRCVYYVDKKNLFCRYFIISLINYVNKRKPCPPTGLSSPRSSVKYFHLPWWKQNLAPR